MCYSTRELKLFHQLNTLLTFSLLTIVSTLSVLKSKSLWNLKFIQKKLVILPYLESTCACKNQLVPNIGNK